MPDNYCPQLFRTGILTSLLFSFFPLFSQNAQAGFVLTSEAGRIYGYFEKITGLPNETNTPFVKTSLHSRFSHLILKNGELPNRKLFNWHQSIRIGRIIPKNLIINQLNSQGRIIKSWKIMEVYPDSNATFNMSRNGTGKALSLKYRYQTGSLLKKY